MKINYIKYHNYRCFEDVSVRFDTDAKKNISLVMGVIGSGKTEMLFSFQWVLYGFDFKRMREKEETPYSLNSALYHRLQTNSNANSVDCWVELSFSHQEREYIMKRTETFFCNKEKVDSKVKVSLSYTERNGEHTLPITDKQKVEDTLTRIIPKSILEGITFDGERMKKLNSADDQAKETIKGVISLVTNESLFTLCNEEIKHYSDEVSKQRQKINRDSGNFSAANLEKEIKDIEEAIEANEINLHGITKNLDKTKMKLEDISQKLYQLEEARRLEEKRKGLEKDLQREKRFYESYLDQFFKLLAEGYFLISDRLMEDVRQSLDKVDIPAGLTVEAVKSILKRPKCICGCDITDDVYNRLTKLMSTLPPDNISSTILYMTNQFGDEKKRTSNLLKEAYTNMHNCEEEVSRIKREFSEISKSLTENVSESVRQLENKRSSLEQNKGKLCHDEECCNMEIERLNKSLKEAKKELQEASLHQELCQKLEKQKNILDLFKDAIKKIEQQNSKLSLQSVNDLLRKAFNTLSEDTGREIYLCQYDTKNKYRLVTYVRTKYNDLYTSWLNNGRIRTHEQSGLSDSEIKEKIILKVAEGKSTGQSKTNSLAFAKAILDYSNEDRSKDKLKVSHDYPFLIDSPFTELSGGNLEKISKNIHTFASQIILMADDKSFSGVKQNISKHICSMTYLHKDKEKGTSYVK